MGVAVDNLDSRTKGVPVEVHSAVNLSLDDLTSFTQPLGGSLSSSGLHQDNSFDASMDGSASFLSGADMSTDTFELVGEDDNDVSGHTNSHGRFSWF